MHFSILIAVFFLGFILFSSFISLLPQLVLLVYGGFSFIAVVIYWVDKFLARNGMGRISEGNLHVIALAGGWPGAIIAQQWFRHKTVKQPFRGVFWMTVGINIIGFCSVIFYSDFKVN